MRPIRLCSLIALFFIASCASSGTSVPQVGEQKSFSASLDAVQAATRHSVGALNVEITSVYQATDGYTIEFKKPASAWSWGEVGKVKVYPSADRMVTVEVFSAKVLKAQRTGTEQSEFAAAIYAGVEQGLDDLSGK